MKFVERSPFADPDAAARKLVEIASGGKPYKMAASSSSGSTSRFWRLALSLRNGIGFHYLCNINAGEFSCLKIISMHVRRQLRY